MDVLIIYPFCTFGGVERVILNRAKLFKQHNQDVRISVAYLRDRGALKSFQDYLRANKLEAQLGAFILQNVSELDLRKYDFIFVIDAPEILEALSDVPNLFIECHTPYREYRQYLGNLPSNLRGIVTPSVAFKEIIESEFPNLPPVWALPNMVSPEFFDIPAPKSPPVFLRSPLTYFARLEDLKNFIEAARIFELFAQQQDTMFIVLGEGADRPETFQSMQRKGLLAKSLLRPHLDFDKIPEFIGLVRQHHGIFISPSKGESFGLSAAEFMTGGVPVLLSDIPCHRELVEDNPRFLYPLGDIFEARDKILRLQQDWQAASRQMLLFREKFRGDRFIAAWQGFLAAQNHSERTR